MKKRQLTNIEEATIYYTQTVEAETEEEAIEKWLDVGDWKRDDEVWHWDSETTAEHIIF